MIVYKEYYNENEKKVKLREYTIFSIYDKAGISKMETNYEEAIHGFNISKESAEKSVEELNNKLADGTYKMQKCKECGIFYLATPDWIKWYTDRDMQVPKRCNKCRCRRKEEKKNNGK